MSMPGLYPQSALGLKIFAVVAAVFRLGQLVSTVMFPRWAAFICKDVAGGTTGLHGSPASSFNTFFYITLYLGAATAIVSFCSTATFLARFVYYRSSHTPGAVPAQPANPSQVPNAVPHQPAGPGHTPNAVSAQPAGPSPSSSAASDPPEGPDGIEMKDLPVSAVHTERESSQQPLLQQPAPDSSIDSSNDGNAPATAAPVPACAGAPIAAGAVAPVAAGAGVPVAAGAGAPVAAGAGAPTATHVGPINFKWIFVFDFVCLLNWGIYLTYVNRTIQCPDSPLSQHDILNLASTKQYNNSIVATFFLVVVQFYFMFGLWLRGVL